MPLFVDMSTNPSFHIVLNRHKVLHDYKIKQEFGFPFPKGAIKWTPSNSVRWPLVCMTAGLMAGLFGIGGGMVKSPLLLEMGVRYCARYDLDDCMCVC